MPPINGVNPTATQTIAAHTVDAGATTPIGQATSASVSFKEGPDTHSAMYAPFAAPDLVKMALSRNLISAQQGKPPSPLICGNERDKFILEQVKKNSITSFKKGIESSQESINLILRCIEEPSKDDSSMELMALLDPTIEGALERNEFSHLSPLELEEELELQIESFNKLSSMLDALTNFEIKSSDALKSLTPEHKLYILGHGMHGSDTLTADHSGELGLVTAEEIADQLAEAGLDKRFTDIRVTSCWSADTRAPTSFQPSALHQASQPLLAPNGDVVAEPFAQTLSNQMKRAGFEQPSVSGYHGEGLMMFEDSDHNVRYLPDAHEPYPRATTVRKVFIPA